MMTMMMMIVMTIFNKLDHSSLQLTDGIVSYQQLAKSYDGTEQNSCVVLTRHNCRRLTAEYQLVVVMVTLHQQNDVGEQRHVDCQDFRPTQLPLQPAVM